MYFYKIIFSLLLTICLTICLDRATGCGQSKIVAKNAAGLRIVGGTGASVGEFPWQVLLTRVYKLEPGGRLVASVCGGTIINDQWILTAAHCVAQSSDTRQYTVILGVHDLKHRDDDDGRVVKADVDMIKYHDDYEPVETVNDIALVKLKGRLDFLNKHKHLEPICLANQSTLTVTKTCVATGFGYTNADGPIAQLLQKVNEPIVDNSQCARIYRSFNGLTNVCAGGTRHGGTGTCMGDSGGPLQCKGAGGDGRWYQVGIVSYGVPCARANVPDVFTKVAAFQQWIKQTIDKLL